MNPSKQELASALRELGLLMELSGENPFRCRAYEQAARSLEGLEGEPREWVESDALDHVKGVGKGCREKVEEHVRDGRIAALDELRVEVPAGLKEMLTIPGLGPKKIKQIWKEKGIETLSGLEEAAKAGQLNDIAGFGARTASKILAGIEQRRQYGARHPIHVASLAADRILERLRAHPDIGRVEFAGSLRRGRETVKDLDFVATSGNPAAIMQTFIETPGVESIVARGETKSSILLEGGIPVDLRVVAPEQFAAALNYFTGSREHNTSLRGRARRLGLKLNEYGLFRDEDGALLETPDEAAIYQHLGLHPISPELREDMGEIEAAAQGELPELIAQQHMAGVLHVHTTYSDGKNTILEMARAAEEAGYKYLVICDHSQSAAYAGGLKPEDLKRQLAEIEHVRKSMKGFQIFWGVESDILADGSLDYDDELLDNLDMVVASVHSRMNMPREEMTQRVCRAIRHPATTVLGHPTGRLLLRREPFEIDLEEVLATAAAHDVAIEINANPWRLDLDWRLIRRAHALGCRFAINPDAHDTASIGHIRFGVAVARKGWLGPKDVINTLPAKAFEQWLKTRKQPKTARA